MYTHIDRIRKLEQSLMDVEMPKWPGLWLFNVFSDCKYEQKQFEMRILHVLGGVSWIHQGLL